MSLLDPRRARAEAPPSGGGLGRWLAGGFLALLALHLALASRMVGPMLFGDEVAPLLVSRFLAGLDPVPRLASLGMKVVAHYQAGYALLLVPAWWLGGGPLAVYRWGLVLNSVALAGLLPLTVAFARRVLLLDYREALLAGLAVAVYPAFTLQSNLTWSESLLLPAVLAVLVSGERLLRRQSTGSAVLLALAAVSCLAIHQRTLALAGLAAVAPLAAAWRRELARRPALLAAALVAAGSVAVGGLHGLLFARLWGGAPRISPLQLVTRLHEAEAWRALALSLAGQVWYLAVASLGLVFLGVAYLVRLALQGGARSRPALFALVAVAALLAPSIAFVTRFDRVDKMFYGRYAEAFLAPLLAAGLAWLLRRRGPRLPWGVASAAALAPLALLLVLFSGHGRGAFAGLYNPLNTLGIHHWLLLMGGLRMLRLSLLGGALALAWTLVGSRFGRAAAVATAVLFLAGSLFSYQRWLVPNDLAVQQRLRLPTAVQARGPVTAVAYDESAFTYLGFFGYQLWLDDVEWRFFESGRGQAPPAELVISDSRFGAAYPEARRLHQEANGPEVLWQVTAPPAAAPAAP